MKRWWWVMLLGLASCATPKPVRAPSGDKPHIKVMTYNVNYGLAGEGTTMAAIAAGDADLIFLQETTEDWEVAIRTALGDAYPYMAFHHCCGAGGLAVLSKTPFEDEEIIEPPPEGWFPAWRVVVDTAIGPVQVLQVHLRPPVSDSGSFVSGYLESPEIHERQMKVYADTLDDSLPTLVVGDFNEDEGDAAIELLAERGLRSVLPEFKPGVTTWRWTTSVGQITSRLDHIVYDPRLVPLDAEVLQVGRSDHLPVVAIFERAD